MKLSELIRFSKGLIKGKTAAIMTVCSLPLISELAFRSAEAAVYSLLLYFGKIQPFSLFSGSNRIVLALTLVITLLRIAVTAPLTFAAASKLTAICGDRKNISSLPRMLMSRRSFRRSLTLSLLSKLCGLIALIPAAFFGIIAYRIFKSADSPERLFMAFHAAVLTAVSLGIWLSVRISLYASPYIMAHFPNLSPIRTIFFSLGFMSGKRRELIMLSLLYLPAALTVIGLPFAITRIKTAFALSIAIHIKEDEYFERNKIYRLVRSSRNAAKIPHRKARRFKKTPHTAETN